MPAPAKRSAPSASSRRQRTPSASSTTRQRISAPQSKCKHMKVASGGFAGSSFSTSTGATIRAPNLSICNTPRVASSAPLSPAGKPMKFSIRDEPPAWPPGPSRSSIKVDSPSDEA